MGHPCMVFSYFHGSHIVIPRVSGGVLFCTDGFAPSKSSDVVRARGDNIMRRRKRQVLYSPHNKLHSWQRAYSLNIGSLTWS